VKDGYIVADTVQLHITDSPPPDVPNEFCAMLVNLLACYFAWDLSYPTAYQILVMLHQHVFSSVQEKMFKSVALIKLEKQLI